MKWTALDRRTYQVSWNGAKWRLKATPGAKYPWVLFNGAGVAQEIGAPDLVGAQSISAVWLDLWDRERMCGMGDKHSGESDTQTDHVGQGSDGHTTESGSDK